MNEHDEWVSKMQYGECPNCDAWGKEDIRHYRKLDERSFWVSYKICKICNTPFDHYIDPDVGTEFWQHEGELRRSLSGLFDDMAEEFVQSMKLQGLEFSTRR